MTSIGLSAITAAHVTISAAEPAPAMPGGAEDVLDELVVITDVDAEHVCRPVAIADRRSLALLGAGTAPLRDLVFRLPALFTVEAEDDSLELRALLVIADTLSLLPEVHGVLLERKDRPFAAISRAKVAAVLPISLLSEDELRGDSPPTMPSIRYVCRKCMPHSVHISLTVGPAAPSCRKVWFHGPMTSDGYPRLGNPQVRFCWPADYP
jgi:hypothetical protein